MPENGGVKLVSISEFRQLYRGEWYHPTGQLGYFCTGAFHQEYYFPGKISNILLMLSYESCCKRHSFEFYYENCSRQEINC